MAARVTMERSGELEVFLRVVQEGAFAAAARSLDLTPSAVSKLVARLEARLGARLLVRTTRALSLTDEGEAYHRAGLEILQALDAAEQAAAAGAVRGRLRVSASLPFGAMFIAPLIPTFLQRHPDVVVDLSLTDELVDLVAQRTDVAIRVGELGDSGLKARKLGQTRRVLVAAPSYLARAGRPETPHDLARHECLAFNFRRAGTIWRFVVDGREFEFPVSGNLLVNNGETMRQMVLAGAGVARLGRFHVADALAAGALVALLENYNPGDLEIVSALYLGGGVPQPRIRAFIDYLVEALADVPTLRDG
jgi:DNA-binding transcriptional LysR family regulator